MRYARVSYRKVCYTVFIMPRESNKEQWSAAGLARLGDLIEKTIKQDWDNNQNEFSRQANLAPNTVSSLQDNRVNHIIKLPTEATIQRLAAQLINERTQQPFTPKELYDLYKGYYPEEAHQSLAEYVNSYVQANTNVSIEAIAAGLGLSKKRFLAIVEDPDDVDEPDLMAFIIRLGSAIGNSLYLAELAGLNLTLQKR